MNDDILIRGQKMNSKIVYENIFDEITIQPGENFAKIALRFMTAFSYRNYLKFLEKTLEFLFKHRARHDRIKNTTGFHIYARK